MAAVRLAVRPAAVECKAAQLAACKAVEQPVVPEQTAAACKVAARRAVDLPAALRVAVECKAAVLLAAAPWVADPWVAVAVIRRPGAELPVVAPKAHKVAVLKAAVVAVAAVR